MTSRFRKISPTYPGRKLEVPQYDVMKISLCLGDSDIDSLDMGYFGPKPGNLRIPSSWRLIVIG